MAAAVAAVDLTPANHLVVVDAAVVDGSNKALGIKRADT